MAERVVLVGYGPVGARFVEELLPEVRAGLMHLTVVGAEADEAYNRVLIADFAVGATERESLDMTDAEAARAAGVRILTGTPVIEVCRTRHTVLLGTGEEVPYDRLVLATGARAQLPTLDGLKRPRRDRMRPDADGGMLDSAGAVLPAGVTVLRDLADACVVAEAVRASRRLVVLGAGVLGMELALAAARAGAEVCVVYHGAVPMERNLDRGGGSVLARSARRAGVAMVAHARAESLLFRTGDDGIPRFDALICADGKQIGGDLLVLSCGIAARVELAALSGLAVTRGILVDEGLRSWTDPDIYAIGDCAHPSPRPERYTEADVLRLPGGPSGLVGAGWRQAEWLARRFAGEIGQNFSGEPTMDREPIALSQPVIMLKAESVDVVAAGRVDADPWDEPEHDPTCGVVDRGVAQWIDPEHGRYVKMVTRDGILEGFIAVGMPRAAAELTLLYERRGELPADRSVLLRYDGPDADASTESTTLTGTVCWCNGVSAERIVEAARAGSSTVECISRDTRAGTGCGGCAGRIGAILAHVIVGGDGDVVDAVSSG